MNSCKNYLKAPVELTSFFRKLFRKTHEYLQNYNVVEQTPTISVFSSVDSTGDLGD